MTDLHHLIAQGENSALEFKSAGVSTDTLAKEMVAFANAQGGVILVGVEDNGRVSGIDTPRQNETWVSNIVRDCVIPPLIPIIKIEVIDGQQILYIEVPKGRNKPYQTNTGKFYIRVGSTNRTPSQAELMRLYQHGGVFHFDSIGVEKTSLQDLNFPKLSAYFERYDVDFNADTDKARLLRNVDVLTDENEVTVAGLLLFGTNPQRHLYNASVSFAYFQGKDLSAPLLNQQTIAGNLDQQIDTAFALLKNSLPNGSTIEGTRTVPSSAQYEDKVFRELLVNACVHRNYAISGSRIRVFVFQDRLEVRSPGRLPNTVTIEKLSAGVSYAVNPVIVKFMENLRYIDKLGRGLPMVWLAAKKMGRVVSFEEIGEEFVVTLPLV